MTIILTIIHVAICLFLILVILFQAGKGADMGAIFGGGGSQTLFGASGGQTFMSKATTALAVAFMLTCLTLAYVSSHSSSIMTDGEEQPDATSEEGTEAGNTAAPTGGSEANTASGTTPVAGGND